MLAASLAAPASASPAPLTGPGAVIGHAPAGVVRASITAGDAHSCALRTDGTVACWGNNVAGQTTSPSGTFTAVAAGFAHTCAIKLDSTVVCWGDNAFGQASVPTGSFISVAAGLYHTCAIRADGTASCWGWNDYGQATAPSGTFGAITAGYAHSCGIETDGTLACWGNDEHGEAVAPTGTFTALDAGWLHACAVRTNGTIACWGNDADGQAAPPTGTFTTVDAGSNHTCAIRTSGTLACWGQSAVGQATPPPGTFVAAAAGTTHSCGVRTDASIDCWGSTADDRSEPPGGSFVTRAVAASGYGSCAIKTNGTVVCWGSGASIAPATGTFTALAVGDDHICGIRTDGTVACWGSDDYGRATPPTGTFTAIAAGEFHTCGLKTDGTAACWGRNHHGQAIPPADTFTTLAASDYGSCGVRTAGTVTCWGSYLFSSATPPPAGTFTALGRGALHTCGVRTNGTLACWGYSSSGATTPPPGTFAAVAGGVAHACAIRTDAGVECWGSNADGQATSPAGGFTAVDAGSFHTCARTFDGVIACWGSNSHGQATPPSHLYDVTPPDTTITEGPNGTTGRRVSFAFAASEAASTFECALDSGAFASCTSSTEYTTLSDGTHTFSVRAIDSGRNIDPTPATRAFSVDAMAPETTIDSGPSGPIKEPGGWFTFSSSEEGSTFECQLDFGSWESCTSPEYHGSYMPPWDHTFSVRATDAYGNTDETPAERVFRVDYDPPETTIYRHPAANTTSTTAEFGAAGDEASSLRCRLDDEPAFTVCPSPLRYTSLNAGSHIFRVLAVDAAGNEDPTPATWEWTIHVPDACTTAPFNDVPVGHPFCPEISWMKTDGLSSGFADGSFRPGIDITRQAMAAFLARLARAATPACTEAPFTDVSVDHPFCKEISWLKTEGITTGFGDGTFRPQLNVTRMAMAAFLARVVGAAPPGCNGGMDLFNDVPWSHPFCKEIMWLRTSGITNGYSDNTFRPANNVTRMAMAAFLYRTRITME